MRTPSPRRITPFLLAGALVFTACGGSDSDDDVEDTVPASEAPATDAPVETAAPDDGGEEPIATEAPATDAPVETAAPDDGGEEPVATEAPEEDAAGGPVDVTLAEWSITAATEYQAGEITFNAINGGSFPHELVVIAGEGYESLPREDGGKVIEEELPTGALIARTERIGSLEETQLTVELAPGSYVLICNLGGGSNSHAGAGQRLDITVTG